MIRLGPTMARDQAILDVLDAPMSVKEISETLRQQALEAWAGEHGYDIEWGTDSEPIGARLLAISEARERGTYAGLGYEVYERMRYLERHGRVERIQLEGHRPMLWRCVDDDFDTGRDDG